MNWGLIGFFLVYQEQPSKHCTVSLIRHLVDLSWPIWAGIWSYFVLVLARTLFVYQIRIKLIWVCWIWNKISSSWFLVFCKKICWGSISILSLQKCFPEVSSSFVCDVEKSFRTVSFRFFGSGLNFFVILISGLNFSMFNFCNSGNLKLLLNTDY